MDDTAQLALCQIPKCQIHDTMTVTTATGYQKQVLSVFAYAQTTTTSNAIPNESSANSVRGVDVDSQWQSAQRLRSVLAGRAHIKAGREAGRH